jgi:hypothetical protein
LLFEVPLAPIMTQSHRGLFHDSKSFLKKSFEGQPQASCRPGSKCAILYTAKVKGTAQKRLSFFDAEKE